MALSGTQSGIWPRLQLFLHDLSWDSHPSKPTPEFFDALSVVCHVLREVSSVVLFKGIILVDTLGSTVCIAMAIRLYYRL